MQQDEWVCVRVCVYVCVWLQFFIEKAILAKREGINEEISGRCVAGKGNIQCKGPRWDTFVVSDGKQGGRVAGKES